MRFCGFWNGGVFQWRRWAVRAESHTISLVVCVGTTRTRDSRDSLCRFCPPFFWVNTFCGEDCRLFGVGNLCGCVPLGSRRAVPFSVLPAFFSCCVGQRNSSSAAQHELFPSQYPAISCFCRSRHVFLTSFL